MGHGYWCKRGNMGLWWGFDLVGGCFNKTLARGGERCLRFG